MSKCLATGIFQEEILDDGMIIDVQYDDKVCKHCNVAGYVAEIIGLDANDNFKRQFLRRIDYSENGRWYKNESYSTFKLKAGEIYEVQPVSFDMYKRNINKSSIRSLRCYLYLSYDEKNEVLAEVLRAADVLKFLKQGQGILVTKEKSEQMADMLGVAKVLAKFSEDDLQKILEMRTDYLNKLKLES